MPVVHIVLFKFKDDTEPSVVKDMCDRMVGLKNTCIHPETQKPYMKSYGGGKNNSPEGAAVSVTMSVRVAQLTKSGWPPIWVRLRV
ncbi:hypothetical protein D6D29_04127 [Aureobasidium pullulans]|nr:hypothetical protein D6D29_04127 [Aureobasidium pullulans]